MTTFSNEFAAGGASITVGSVERRRHVARAMQTLKATRDAALDLGLSRREATAAAIHAVKQIHGLDIAAALGLAPEGVQGEAGRAAGGGDGQSDGERPEPAVGAGDGSLPPRSHDPRALFVDLLDPALGPDLNDAIDRLAELWRIEPDAERLPGDGEFIDDAALRAAGVDLRFAGFFAAALAREERFTAAGWTDSPERDPTHGASRIAMLSPGFIGAVNEFYDLAANAGYIRDHAGRRPGRTLDTSTPPGIAAGVLLGLEYVPAGNVIGRDGTAYHRKAHFVVPGAPARRGLRVA